MPKAWCNSNSSWLTDGYSPIQIQEAQVEDVPRAFAILASIDDHYLTIAFSENLGQVTVEVTTASGATVDKLRNSVRKKCGKPQLIDK